ncbi:Gfo/Idh/MocA family protein [Streptomyces sp. NPDC003444]
MEPVRIGVLGCAGIALRRLLPAMAGSAAVDLVAVASRSAGTAADTARRFGCRPVHGYDALLESADVEAVYVPLPAALHGPWTRAALDAGKHVLAEKPLTTEPALTAELFAHAARAGLALMENVMFLHHSRHAHVLELVAGGAIGEPRAFHAAFAVPRPADGDIRYDPALGGGALLDTGVYPVRAALFHLGAGLRVLGATLANGPGRDVDTAGTALLATPEGVGAQLTFGIDHAYRSSYEIWGSEGRITVERAFTPPADHVPEVRLERRTGTEVLRLAPDDQVLRTVEAFARAVRTGPLSGAQSVRQAELLDEVRRHALFPSLSPRVPSRR